MGCAPSAVNATRTSPPGGSETSVRTASGNCSMRSRSRRSRESVRRLLQLSFMNRSVQSGSSTSASVVSVVERRCSNVI